MSLARRILAEKRALVVPLGVVLAINAVIYAGVVYPLSARVAGAEGRARAAAQAAVDAEAGLRAARAALVGKARADEELVKFYGEVLPADLAGARRVTYLRLAQLAEAEGLRHERRSVREERTRDSRLTKLQTTMVLEGNYTSLRRFIHALETAPEFLVIEDVSLSQAEERGGALVLTIDVSTFFRDGADGR